MDFQRLLPDLEGVLAPAANKEILQIVYFLHKVVPAVPSHSAQVLVCFKIKGFGDSGLLRYTVSPLSSMGPATSSPLSPPSTGGCVGRLWVPVVPPAGFRGSVVRWLMPGVTAGCPQGPELSVLVTWVLQMLPGVSSAKGGGVKCPGTC